MGSAGKWLLAEGTTPLQQARAQHCYRSCKPDWYADDHKRTLFFSIKTHPKLCELKLKHNLLFSLTCHLCMGRMPYFSLRSAWLRLEDFFFPRWDHWYGWQIDAVCQLVAHFLSRKDFLKGRLSFIRAWQVGSKNKYSRDRHW